MNLKLIAVAGLVLVAGCNKKAEGVAVTTNGEVKVELLFTNDGCSVYRFLDGDYHYYADCGGTGNTIRRVTSTGKTTIVQQIPDDVPNARPKR